MPEINLKISDYLVDIDAQIELNAYGAALEICKKACKRLPNRPAAFLRLAIVHKLMGHYSDATHALETSKSKGLPDGKYFAQKLEILWVANDYANYISTGLHMRQSGLKISKRISSNMIKCYYMAKDWAEAESEADIRLEQDITPVFSNYKIIAALMADNLCNPIGVLESRIFGPLGNPFMAMGVLTVHMHMDEDADALHDIAQRMAAKWPEHPAVLSLIVELKQFSSEPGTINNRHLKTGADVIEDAENVFGAHAELAATFKRSLSGKKFQRDLVIDIATKDVLVSPRGDSDTVALVFLGAGGRAMGPVQLIDAYLAAVGITAIYIRDLNRLIFATGVKSLGDIDSSASKLPEIIADIGGAKKIIAIGFSGGGLGALNIGVTMDVDRIICFSTPANVTLEFLESIGDTRAPIFKYRLNSQAVETDLDVKTRIDRYNFTAPIELYFSNKVAIDRAHAEYLGDLPNVQILPFHTKYGHNTLMAAIASGWLAPILSGDISEFDGKIRPDLSE